MKLSALRLHNVRRFANRGVAIEGIRDGVNVLCAVNEFGKSTCFDALHALFFQPYSGTPGAVNLLRPYSGGSPLIEADIITNDGEFRLQKRFYSGRRAIVTDLRSGRLVAQADEAERIISDLVRGGTAGPAGLLWVRQGITGLDRRAKSEEEGEKRARETTLSSVQGEVEALTGGRRMSDVLNACAEELLTLVTASGKPKSGGLYASAIEERDRLKAVELRLEVEVNDLRGALDERRKARSQLKEIEDATAVATRRQAAEAAEKSMAEGQAHAQALETAKVELTLLTNAFDQAKAYRDAYRAALTRAETLKIVRSQALERREGVLEQQRLKVRAIEEADQAVDSAERDEQMARDLLTQLEQARRASEALTKLVGLREALSKAEAAQREIEGGEAALRTLVVPPEQLKELERLEIEIAGLTAAQAARAPTLRVVYEAGAENLIAIDGHPFSDGEERPLQPHCEVVVPGVATLAFKTERDEKGKAPLAAAASAHQNLLVKIGVKSLVDARQREANARSKHAEIELSKQRLALFAPKGLATIREDIARLERQATDVPDIAGDPEVARAAWKTADRRVADARNLSRELRPAREQAEKAVIASEKGVATVTAELVGTETILGSEPDRPERERALTAAFDKASVAHAEADAKRAALQGSAPDLASLDATLQRTRSAVDAAATQSTNLREALADLNGRIRTRSDDAVEEVWLETKALREEADKCVAQFEREVAVLSKLRNRLEAARAAARDHYFEPVMMELRPLMGLLFEDASVAFDDATLLPTTVQRNGETEDVDRLSGGMREQLAVLTRLAFARLLARDGRPAPVILDDALVYSDDDRIEKMFDALHRQSRDQQIIVFSCRQRAFAGLGGNILRMTDWKPQSL